MPDSDLRTWSRRIREFPHREWVLVLIVAYSIISAVVAILFLFVALGRNVQLVEHDTNLLWNYRGLVEVAFFWSQIGVAIAAIVALVIARGHSTHMKDRTDEAVRARKATVYMEINDRFNSPEITYSRLKLIYLQELHDSLGRPEPLDEFIHHELRALYNAAYAQFDETQNGECEYTRTTKILSFLEDVGVLVEKKYVDADDVLNFLGSVITMVDEQLREHINSERQRAQDPALYANLLKLMAHASSFSYTTFDEGVYRLRPGTGTTTEAAPH